MDAKKSDYQLFSQYHEKGDLGARKQLIERYLPLAERLAARYRYSSEDIEDLTQVASVGLINSIDHFDISRNNRFVTYAVPTIVGELKRHFRDKTWALNLPRRLQELVLKIDTTVDNLAKELKRTPSAREIATALEVSIEEILEAMAAANLRDWVSLDQVEMGSDGPTTSLEEKLGKGDEHFEIAEDMTVIEPIMQKLSQRERLILKLRFFDGLAQSQIAEEIGVSQMQVSRMLRRIVARLRVLAAEKDQVP